MQLLEPCEQFILVRAEVGIGPGFFRCEQAGKFSITAESGARSGLLLRKLVAQVCEMLLEFCVRCSSLGQRRVALPLGVERAFLDGKLLAALLPGNLLQHPPADVGVRLLDFVFELREARLNQHTLFLEFAVQGIRAVAGFLE